MPIGQPFRGQASRDRDAAAVGGGEKLGGLLGNSFPAYGKDAGVVVAQPLLKECERVVNALRACAVVSRAGWKVRAGMDCAVALLIRSKHAVAAGM